MHVLFGILGVVGALTFWYFRLKQLHGAASEVVDVADRVRGALRRRSFRKKTEGSPLTAIDDPVTAAAVMMYAIATVDGAPGNAAEAVIRNELARIAPGADIEELLTFAGWAARQVDDPDNVSLKLAGIWRRTLTSGERKDLYAMTERVADCGEQSPIKSNALRTLGSRLSIKP